MFPIHGSAPRNTSVKDTSKVRHSFSLYHPLTEILRHGPKLKSCKDRIFTKDPEFSSIGRNSDGYHVWAYPFFQLHDQIPLKVVYP